MLLWAIIVFSALLACAAILLLALLIGMRVVRARRTAARDRRYTDLLRSVLAWLQTSRAPSDLVDAIAADPEVSTALLIELLEVLRGFDQERLVSLAISAGLDEHMRDTLLGGRYPERLAAAETLAAFPSAKTRDALREALEDPADDVALAAAASLVEFGEKLALGQLLRRRIRAARSRHLEGVLARAATRQADDLMRLACDAEQPDPVRAACVQALARANSLPIMEEVAALAGDPSPSVRAAVARALGLFGHPLAEDAVLGLLEDPRWKVRAEAAEAVGRIGLVGATKALCGLLEDRNWWVRFRAAEALAQLGPAGIACLRDAAGDGSGGGRIAALMLAERGLV